MKLAFTPASARGAALAIGALLALPHAAEAATPATGGQPAPAANALSLDAGAVYAGRSVRLTGTVPDVDAGRPVLIQRRRAGRWETIARTEADGDSYYSAVWHTERPGRYTVRAVVGEARLATRETTPPGAIDKILVLTPAKATWYGPGFFGRRTACGQALTTTLQGVAHRTLPCGTKVTVYYGGASVTVPVVDRGPFANGALFDLTAATAGTLGFEHTATIGYLVARAR